MRREIDSTVVYQHLMESDKRITVMQGGTRSGKTYNILIWLIAILTQEKNKIVSICRQTTPSLKKTVMRDFFDILQKTGFWNEANWKETDRTYKFKTNTIEFLNLDDDQKVRGGKRDYLFINEANEVKLPIWKQLLFRTTTKIILDYNPSDEFHWIYDEVIPRDDCDFLKTTYKDNRFLPPELIREIERLKEIDPNYWAIYGLGEKGASETTIYRNWELCKEFPEEFDEVYYGLDFGFNHPMAFVMTGVRDKELFIKELYYESNKTVGDLKEWMLQKDIPKGKYIFGDSSRPEMIDDVHRDGYNIHSCKKGAGSVKAGIDQLKRFKIWVDPESVNLIKELKSYKWKVDKDGRVLDEPVKVNDDAMDAMRYSVEKLIEGQDEFKVMDFKF